MHMAQKTCPHLVIVGQVTEQRQTGHVVGGGWKMVRYLMEDQGGRLEEEEGWEEV